MPRELTVELLFDSTDSESLDVREVTNKLLKAMEVGEGGGGGGRPPMITFGWGQSVPFKAFGRQLNVRSTMFKQDRTPTRALAMLTLIQAEKAQDSSEQARRNSRRRQPDDAGDRRDSLPRRSRRRQSPVHRLPGVRRPDALACCGRGERHRRSAEPAPRHTAGHPEVTGMTRMVDTLETEGRPQ